MPTRRLREHVERAAEAARWSCSSRVLLALQPGLDPAQLGDHDRLAVAQDRDLAGELVDLGVVVGELAREHALAVLLLRRARPRFWSSSRLQVLGAGAAGAESATSSGEQRATSAPQVRSSAVACLRVVADVASRLAPTGRPCAPVRVASSTRGAER